MSPSSAPAEIRLRLLLRSSMVQAFPLPFPLAESYISELRTFVPFDTLRSDAAAAREVLELLLDTFIQDKSGLHVFNFLANSILKEVLSAIQQVKPGAFSPGRPTEFLKNYKASLDFLAYLEVDSYHIPFYEGLLSLSFELKRFQEISGALDSALTSPSLVFIQDSDLDKRSSPKLMLRQSSTLLESLRSCWKEDVLVFSAADKFLRLTLQLL